jgi:fumarylacetoacetase
MIEINETHDPQLRSWVAGANEPDTDFPIQNLPLAIFRRAGAKEEFRGGVAIGDQILDLSEAYSTGLFSGLALEALSEARREKLNRFMALGRRHWSALRLALSRLLSEAALEMNTLKRCLVPQSKAEFDVPAVIGDFTDFYSSIYHAQSVGRMFRPENPLMPNYKWVPVAYHARASSIRVSGHQFPRPCGQRKAPDSDVPVFGPSKRIDYELELGLFVGPGNPLGTPIRMDSAEDHIFGLCLLNDWSARDIQSWEYQPLGPFLGKNFATTISPWIITLEALEPFRKPWTRPSTDPQPLPYLDSDDNRFRGAFDVKLEVCLLSETMNSSGAAPVRLSSSNYVHSYWTLRQLIAHHTSNGCNLLPGDFIGTGTISGPCPEEVGSILELTKGGKTPFQLPTSETRKFIEDGDTVIMRARSERAGFVPLGFGECAGTILPPAN